MNPARPPSSDRPTAVLATDPPETNRGACITCWTVVACARSIRVIDPLANPTWSSTSSETTSSTSSKGDPMATRSNSDCASSSFTGVSTDSFACTEREPTRSEPGSLPDNAFFPLPHDIDLVPGRVPPAPDRRAPRLPHRDRAGRGIGHLLGDGGDRRHRARDGGADRPQCGGARHQRRGGAHRRAERSSAAASPSRTSWSR